MSMIQNNEYRILSGVYEYHPLKECEKICRYMDMKYDEKIKRLFTLTFSTHPIEIKGSFQPIMNEIHQKYLDGDGLKLRKLNRKCSATP